MDEKAAGQTENAEVSRSFVASANGENVKVSSSGVGVVSAGSRASLHQGGAAIVAAGQSVEVLQAGAQMIVAGSEMRVMQGGGQLMLSGGYMKVEQGGGLVMITSRANVKRSYVGVLISGSTQLQEGTKVLLGTTQAAAFGAALGLVFAAASRLLRGRR